MKTNAKEMELREENNRLRAALAQSPGACHYCQLPKEQWAACKSGIRECNRMHDAFGCPEFGAMIEYGVLRDKCAELVKTWRVHGPNSGFTGNAIEDMAAEIKYSEEKGGK